VAAPDAVVAGAEIDEEAAGRFRPQP
jgi:hypothetical protein